MKSKIVNAISAIFTLTDSDLAYNIIQRLNQSKEFTTVPKSDPSDVLPISLCLFSIPEYSYADSPVEITHVGLLRKGQRVATSQVRLTASNLIDFRETPLSGGILLTELLEKMPNKFHKYVLEAFKGDYNKLGNETGKELLKAVLKLRPQKELEIKRLVERLTNRKSIFRGPRFQNAAGEKDALGLCLDIFGFDRKVVLQSWLPPNEGQTDVSFLSGLKKFAAYEDDLINFDLNNLPGFTSIQKSIAGIVEFKNSDGDNLVVINANRKPLEKAFGVDLIYFHRKYNAFTFVQYKMMNSIADNVQSIEHYYNPNQQSHHEELTRMKVLYGSLCQNKHKIFLNDYRISDCPIFFKICKKIQFNADDASIVPGAYIPLSQWEILIKDDSTKGPKGGRQIGFHTLKKRYIGTTVFVELVKRGFFGTQSYSSSKIASFIEEAISQGHTVMYAIDNSTNAMNDEDEISGQLDFEIN